MKRGLWICSLLFLLPGLAWADEKIEIYGYSYFTPPEAVGTVTTLVAALEPPVGFSYPFAVDFIGNEYTCYWQGTITNIAAGPMTTTITYGDADLVIYEDPAKNSDYGANPPNGTSPASYTDGVEVLSGTLSNITRVDYNMGFPEPTIVADCNFTGGSKLGELVQGENWTFNGGISSNPLWGIPPGYQRNWAAQIVFTGPVGALDSTWGAVKALYRQDRESPESYSK